MRVKIFFKNQAIINIDLDKNIIMEIASIIGTSKGKIVYSLEDTTNENCFLYIIPNNINCIVSNDLITEEQGE